MAFQRNEHGHIHLRPYLTSSWVRVVGEVLALDDLDLRVVDLSRTVKVPTFRA